MATQELEKLGPPEKEEVGLFKRMADGLTQRFQGPRNQKTGKLRNPVTEQEITPVDERTNSQMMIRDGAASLSNKSTTTPAKVSESLPVEQINNDGVDKRGSHLGNPVREN